ncbi:Leu/Phe-tRNA protein transferase, putative [Babesia bigemina]|uniref:Leu/Phe-tRNA protein transferase, putative n=1 Tax=Babesia bigemina TaxID=5866 RepID=A0A061D8H2_BABBI|nr:Leu/Phe-tRNA protein transferase, putative [Babesia bigemina]CDR94045.1 Leu/Phe-tRNA protein transferase, putative [Babesia bigemina]|eukprot:XP_012766231.1 Leu/Phe-tRNA protein transferase, putative [Babesia bigemina]
MEGRPFEGGSVGGRCTGCGGSCPWELEEQANLEWDRRLAEMLSWDIVRPSSASFDSRHPPAITAEYLEHCSCFAISLHTERWRRLVSTIKDANEARKGMTVDDSVEELLKLEVLLFTDHNVECRRQLARGLLVQVWRDRRPTKAPWYSKLMQLVRDLDALCFLHRLHGAQRMVSVGPMVTPYSYLNSVIAIFRHEGLEGETVWSPYIEGELMYRLSGRGFLTIAISVDALKYTKRLLVPKMHTDRCFMRPTWIRMTRRAKRLAKGLRVTLDTAFHQALVAFAGRTSNHLEFCFGSQLQSFAYWQCQAVIDAIVQQHGANWMYPEVCTEFNRMHYQRHRFGSVDTRLHSVEVWRGDELIAGEIGCTLNALHRYIVSVSAGAVYTSLTGFHLLDSSGTFQMYALAAILHFSDVELWDLGMEIPYKCSLGGTTMPRIKFIEEFHRLKQIVGFSLLVDTPQERHVHLPSRFRENENCVSLLEEFEAAQQRVGMEGSAPA